eukprot:TRINITY_DN70082_c0_g1_i1.p1 TRINITY_DN70082_c0_g1~~TRINITY_DN70082_c0_g1_i1.p1  ORF type:complete len:676 (-),score=63.19 TRINITY_DN70082_c0_g1_i1:643-2370(-)
MTLCMPKPVAPSSPTEETPLRVNPQGKLNVRYGNEVYTLGAEGLEGGAGRRLFNFRKEEAILTPPPQPVATPISLLTLDSTAPQPKTPPPTTTTTIATFTQGTSSSSSSDEPRSSSGSSCGDSSSGGVTAMNLSTSTHADDSSDSKHQQRKSKTKNPNNSSGSSGNSNNLIRSYSISPGVVGMEFAQQPSKKTKSNGRTSSVNFHDFQPISRTLGSGVTGYVVTVKHTKTGTLYAKKVIPVEKEEVAKSLVAELSVIQDSNKISNEFLVQSYEAFFVGGDIHIIMEMMDQGSLKDLLAKIPGHQIPLVPLRALVYQITCGMLFLHSSNGGRQQSILHRDIKPANLLLSSTGHAKISDFGCIAKVKHTMAEAKSWTGTVRYMSPERLNNKNYTTSTDIWALGLVAAECSLGRFPVPGGHGLLEVALAVEKPFLDTLKDELSAVDPQLFDFVSACCQIDPAARPHAADMLKHPFLAPIKDNLHVEKPTAILARWLQSLQGDSSESSTSAGRHSTPSSSSASSPTPMQIVHETSPAGLAALDFPDTPGTTQPCPSNASPMNVLTPASQLVCSMEDLQL